VSKDKSGRWDATAVSRANQDDLSNSMYLYLKEGCRRATLFGRVYYFFYFYEKSPE
jgi:hypothetical protein